MNIPDDLPDTGRLLRLVQSQQAGRVPVMLFLGQRASRRRQPAGQQE